MRRYRIYQVDAFTREKLLGNPAGVVANADGLCEAEMLAIAREFNLSETAFILPPSAKSHDVWVRFFTPEREVPICGHATVAAHYIRAVENHLGNIRVIQRTGAGELPVDIVQDREDYRMIMTQGGITWGETLTADRLFRLIEALGIYPGDLRDDLPVQVVSTGHSKVMVPLRDTALLHRLRPDAQQLTQLSQDLACNGYYPFTLNPGEEALVHGRMFAPAIGIAEDPVTGNANGPLGAYLVRHGYLQPKDGRATFTAVQGEAIRRRGSMEVVVHGEPGAPTEVQIIGNAVIAFSATLTLEAPNSPRS